MIDCAPGRCIYSSGDRINRKYKVLKKLGEGTFGTVYKVQDLDGQDYALKLLKLWEVNQVIEKSLSKDLIWNSKQAV